MSAARLLQLSGAVIDLVYRVERLPAPGEEIAAATATMTAGGGFNAMAAARRLSLEVGYGGLLGDGPFAALLRQALEAEGIESLHRPRIDRDQGSCVVLVDATGERSFVSREGVEHDHGAADLAALPLRTHDWLLLSGYSLVGAGRAEVWQPWLQALPPGTRLFFDPRRWSTRSTPPCAGAC